MTLVASAETKPVEPSVGTAVMGKPAQPFVPTAPATFEEAGLDPGIVETLILKHLAAVGSATGAAIAGELCLPADPVVELLALLKNLQIVVHVGATELGDFKYTLTDTGRGRAKSYFEESRYVGPAPVPLDAYVAAIGAQSIAGVHPQEEDLRRAFGDLLISNEMFQTLGPAINSGKGMFLYGFPGNGKSSIAERVTRCFGDDIYIPRCLIVDGLIIKLFDEANHEALSRPKDSIFKKDRFDRRWVRIRRPTIMVGGELTLEALEVRYSPTSKTCEAPVQMKSNCGTLVIDDFGRQRVKPADLLNRWIVPLEKRFDFLTLPNGRTITIPFDQLIIFATNLEPRDLCDEAFLRRIPYKINVPDPTEEQFRKLFEFVGPSLGFKIDPRSEPQASARGQAEEAIDHLIETHYKQAGRPFRYCQPRDLLSQVRNRCRYLGEPIRCTPDLFDYAVSVYFTVM